MKFRLAMLALMALVLGACGGAAAAEPAGGWRSQHFVTHPLVGRIWSVARQAFVDEDVLVRAAAAARYVLLGETHDNADHHLLQARLVTAIAAAGRTPVVALEMVPADKAQALADHLAAHPLDAAGLGEALDWDASGWPAWPLYEPVAQAALDAGLTLVAGDLDPALRKRIGQQGLEALQPEARAAMALDGPLSDAAVADLEETLRVSHCGLLPEAAVGAIFQVQRARDAALAQAMLSAGEAGAILIAGGGHARADYAVPWYLRALDPTGPIVSIGFTEVEPDGADPHVYLPGPEGVDFIDGIAPFDYLWFTPKGNVSDHCAELKERFGKPAN